MTRYVKQFKNPPLVIIVTSDNRLKYAALAKEAGADGLVDKGGDLHGQLRLLFQKLFGFMAEPEFSPAPSKPISPPDSGCGESH